MMLFARGLNILLLAVMVLTDMLWFWEGLYTCWNAHWKDLIVSLLYLGWDGLSLWLFIWISIWWFFSMRSGLCSAYVFVSPGSSPIYYMWISVLLFYETQSDLSCLSFIWFGIIFSIIFSALYRLLHYWYYACRWLLFWWFWDTLVILIKWWTLSMLMRYLNSLA